MVSQYRVANGFRVFIPISESMFRRSVDYKAMYEGRLIRIRHCLSLFISNLNTSLY
jgi:hypothetical protein